MRHMKERMKESNLVLFKWVFFFSFKLKFTRWASADTKISTKPNQTRRITNKYQINVSKYEKTRRDMKCGFRFSCRFIWLPWLINTTKMRRKWDSGIICQTFMMRFQKWELILYCLCGFEIHFFLLFIKVFFWSFLYCAIYCFKIPTHTHAHIIYKNDLATRRISHPTENSLLFSISAVSFACWFLVNWIIFDFV